MDKPQDVFRTHANYLRAFALLARGGITNRLQAYEDLCERVTAAGSMSAAPIPNTNHDQVRRILENGWGTELLIILGESIIKDDDLVRVSNNWSAVQCYYTAYHATQALVVATGQARAESHPKTQKQFASLWANRSYNIAPWTLGATSSGYRNIPTSINLDANIHSWTACTNITSWSLACKALKTTRQDAFPEALRKKRDSKRAANRKAWQEEEMARIRIGRKPGRGPTFKVPQLTDIEKQDAQNGVRPATLIDYLYRVRIKTNYEDSAMFTDGPEDGAVSNEIRNHLCVLSATTLLLHEMHIAPLVGKQRFIEWVRHWVADKLPRTLTAGLAERVGIHERLCA